MGTTWSVVTEAASEIGVRRPEVPPLVWVTFGTVNTAFAALASTWRTVLAAVDGLPVRVIASTGRGTALQAVPTGIEVVEWVELADVLARASVVVCHGGSGTTLATLAAGIPLVVIPLLADQPTNAAMVDDLGAGISIRAEADGDTPHGLTAADVPRVRTALQTVLTTESYAAAGRGTTRGTALRSARAAAAEGPGGRRPLKSEDPDPDCDADGRLPLGFHRTRLQHPSYPIGGPSVSP